MKLSNDYVAILTSLRDESEIKTESALAAIEAVQKKYADIANRKRISGYERITQEYDCTISKINQMTNFAKTLVYLLSEPGSSGWDLASAAIDSLCEEDD